MRTYGKQSQRGYSLIEVIVAFALLAGALTLLLGTLSGATRQVRWSGDAGRAALHAQSLLDTFDVTETLRPMDRRGDFEDGRYRWQLRVSPWTDPTLGQLQAQMPADAAQRPMYELELDIRWGEGGPRERWSLHSLRLGDAPGVLP